MDLKTFLLARIEEDEKLARSAGGEHWWVDGPAEQSGQWWVYDTGAKFSARETADHIAAHDPARVLAECAAKRAIAEQAVTYSPELEHGDNGEWAFDATLRALAAVYVDHPDYQPEWAQEASQA